MRKSRFVGTFSRLLDIRPGEGRTAVLLFLFFFLITFPAYIVKPLRLSLFFIGFPPKALPFAYLISAVLIGFVVVGNSRLMKNWPRKRYVTVTFIFFISGFLVFWALFKTSWNGMSLLYWFWSDIFMATSVTMFWISVNDVLLPHQAKRLIGFFVGGGILGGIGGSLLSLKLVRTIGSENLLLIVPGILVLSMVVGCEIYKGRDESEAKNRDKGTAREKFDPLESYRLVRSDRYLILLAGFLGTTAVVSCLIDFQFSTVLSWKFPNKDPRTAFLASFNAILLAVSYLLQLLGTGRVLRKFGVRAGLLATPALLMAGSASVFIFPTGSLIDWAVGIRGADKSLENSLGQSVRELLFIPIPASIKIRTKMFIDMFVNKSSAALGAVLLLLVSTVLGLGIESITFFVIAFLAFQILLARKIYIEYLGVVKRDLKRKWEDGEKIVAEHMDLDATKLVFDTIQSRERSSVLYAMNLFDLIRVEKLTPELRDILQEKKCVARIRSMDSVFDVEGGSATCGMEDAVFADDLAVQVGEILDSESYRKIMGEHIEKLGGREATSETERMEAAKILGMMRAESRTLRQLDRLLEDESPDVLNYALTSAARLGKKRHVLPILRHLASPQTRHVAADALSRYGIRIMGTLVDRLEDRHENPDVRRAIPDILAGMGTQKAADILVAALQKDDGAVEGDIISALYRIRTSCPDIVFKEKKILPSVWRQLQTCYRMILESENPDAVCGRIAVRLRMIFHLLTLVHHAEDIVKGYQNILQGTGRTRDHSLELLDNLIRPDIKVFLFPLIEDLPFEERARRLKRLSRSLDEKANGVLKEKGTLR